VRQREKRRKEKKKESKRIGGEKERRSYTMVPVAVLLLAMNQLEVVVCPCFTVREKSANLLFFPFFPPAGNH